MHHFICKLGYLCLAASIATAQASNLTFLDGSVAEKLNKEDVRLLMKAVNDVLSNPVTPARGSWRNEQTGHRGELRTLSVFTGPNAVQCKRLRVINHAENLENKVIYTFCDIPPNHWQQVPSDYAPHR